MEPHVTGSYGPTGTQYNGGCYRSRVFDDALGDIKRRKRKDAFSPFLHRDNHHRSHTALGGRPPISRVNNLAGHYN
jgi:hypothetical protein